MPEQKETKTTEKKTYGTGIGKYINKNAKRETIVDDGEVPGPSGSKKKKKMKSTLNDFSEW